MGNKPSNSSKPPIPSQSKPTPSQCPSNKQMITDMTKFGLNHSWLKNFWNWKYTSKGSSPGQPSIDYDKMIAEMERLEKINDLQSEYNTAEDNLVNGPQIVGKAAYNLIDFRDGEKGYDAFIQKYLSKRVDEMVAILKAKFTKEIEDAVYLNTVYDTTWKNSRNTTDLFNELKKDNISLERKINEDHSLISKNNRKSFYEDDKLVRMKTWNQRICWFYYTFSILYIIIVSFFSSYSSIIKIACVAFFLSLPFFIHAVYIPIFLWILSVLYHIYDYYIPKDVYMSLDT